MRSNAWTLAVASLVAALLFAAVPVEAGHPGRECSTVACVDLDFPWFDKDDAHALHSCSIQFGIHCWLPVNVYGELYYKGRLVATCHAFWASCQTAHHDADGCGEYIAKTVVTGGNTIAAEHDTC